MSPSCPQAYDLAWSCTFHGHVVKSIRLNMHACQRAEAGLGVRAGAFLACGRYTACLATTV